MSVTRRLGETLPIPLIMAVAGVAGLGVVNLASASRSSYADIHLTQLGWLGIGFAVAAVTAIVDYRVIARFSYAIYGAVVIMLALVLVIGLQRMGAQRWLGYGPIVVQPSELAKLALVLALAKYFENLPQKGPFSNWELRLPFLMILVPAGLVIKEPDLGTGGVIMLIGFSILLFTGIRFKSLLILFTGGLASVIVGWFFVLKPYQKQRVFSFLNPEADALGAGYHSMQSLIAIGSGQMAGKGWGEGTQTQLSFLPEQHTDFVFSVWAEEWGLLGGILLIVLYAVILLSIVSAARETRDRFGALICIGVAALIFWQMLINICMVTGLMPVVGVTLPLFSYGGSSLLTIMVGVGLVINVSIRRFLF